MKFDNNPEIPETVQLKIEEIEKSFLEKKREYKTNSKIRLKLYDVCSNKKLETRWIGPVNSGKSCWFLALDGKDVGPDNLPKRSEKYEQGKISGATSGTIQIGGKNYKLENVSICNNIEPGQESYAEADKANLEKMRLTPILFGDSIKDFYKASGIYKRRGYHNMPVYVVTKTDEWNKQEFGADQIIGRTHIPGPVVYTSSFEKYGVESFKTLVEVVNKANRQLKVYEILNSADPAHLGRKERNRILESLSAIDYRPF